MKHLLLTLIAICTLSSAFMPRQAYAQGADVVCAAILACDEDGQVSLPYRNGACAEYYARQCASELANSIATQLAQCQDQHEMQQIKIRKLQNRNRRLVTKIKAAKISS